jgi:Ca-activated chloride channel family protein
MPTIGQNVDIVTRANTFPAGDRASEASPVCSNTLQVKVDLVLVPVAVTDPLGRLVTGLDRDNFEIFEGKERQAIKTFSSEDSPVSVGIIFDTSGSMTDKIELAREAVSQLLQTANPEDEFFLITFADSPEIVTDFGTRVGTFRTDCSIRLRKEAPPCLTRSTSESQRCDRLSMLEKHC